CWFKAHGLTFFARTTCTLKIQVRGEKQTASASLKSPRCRSIKRPYLKYDAALRELRRFVAREHGESAEIFGVIRLGRFRYGAIAEWQEAAEEITKSCEAD